MTGSSSWGAVANTPIGSASLTGTTGATSSLVGLVTSFLPKKLPKIEFLLAGLGAVSRAGVTAVGKASLVVVPAVGSIAAAEAISPAPAVLTPSVGTTGSATTRLAKRY